jgi:hypothetical protein
MLAVKALFQFFLISGLHLDVDSFEYQSLDLSEIGDHIEISRLHLGENAELHLQDLQSLRIKQLIARKGSKIKISSLASGDHGGPGTSGADGSKVTLFIDKIDGDVVIESRGGDGGHGKAGRHGRPGASGSKGRHAVQFFGIFFGPGGNGLAGLDGENGEDGQDGGHGGHGGEVRLVFHEKTSKSSIFVDVQGGSGGRGGYAGLGGIGGPGGRGGEGNPRGLQGVMGSRGLPGRSGRPGEPGTAGVVSIFQVSKSIYQCLMQAYLFGGELKACD